MIHMFEWQRIRPNVQVNFGRNKNPPNRCPFWGLFLHLYTLENPHFQQGTTCSNWWVFQPFHVSFRVGTPWHLGQSTNPNWAFQAQRGASNLGYWDAFFKRGGFLLVKFWVIWKSGGPEGFPIKMSTCFPGLIYSLLRDNWSSHFSRRYNLHICVLLGWWSSVNTVVTNGSLGTSTHL